MPFKRRGVVPPEGFNIEGGAGIAFQRLGGAERTDRSGQVVMPGAGISVVFLVIESVILLQHQLYYQYCMTHCVLEGNSSLAN